MKTPIDSLTPREWQIVRGIAQGLQDKEIARVVGCSTQTVKTHSATIHQKLGVDSRVRVLRAVGWLRAPGEAAAMEYLQAIGWSP